MTHSAPARSIRRPLLLVGILLVTSAAADPTASDPAGQAAMTPPSDAALLAATDEAAAQPRRRKPVPAEVDGKYWGGGVWQKGCVDCHNEAADDGYVSLGVLLKRVGHGIPPNHVKTVPNGCKKCHKDGGSAYPFATLIHSVHFDYPDQNAYVQDFGGSCIGCHRMNTDRGVVSVKRGPRNW